MSTTYDLAVLGSGSAGTAAAIRARSLGASVVMVEEGTVGGTCVNTGCIPSKALLAAAGALDSARRLSRFPGLTADVGPVDLRTLVADKDALVATLRTERYVDLAALHGWDVLAGRARFHAAETTSPGSPANAVSLDVAAPDGSSSVVRAAHVLVATGSAAWIPPVPGLAQTPHLTSTTAMDLDDVPTSLLVLGAGPVALEQAQLFARLGSRVTVIARSRVLSDEDPDAADALESALRTEGIEVLRDTTVRTARQDPRTGETVLRVSTPAGARDLRAGTVLVATGRRPRTQGLGLDEVGVRTGGRDEVVVDTQMRTTHPRIWAAGDVTGGRALVSVAAAEGALAAEDALGGPARPLDRRHVPRVVFTSPALAAVGMTQQQAADAGLRTESRTLPLAAVPRAVVSRQTAGHVTMVAEAVTGRILGITAVGAEAGELVAAGVYVLTASLTVDQVATLWSPYLTASEALRLTAQSFRTDVSTLSCCAT